MLATNKTSTMQKEMQQAAEAGFRFGDVMGGDTAMTFPLNREDGAPLFDDTGRVAELIVRIVDKEGPVEWALPASVRARFH